MAELPDLTVLTQILSRRFEEKTLRSLEISVAKKLNVKVKELETAILGKKLSSVSRYGKTLQLHFSGGTVLQIHLMLRGELVLLQKNDPLPKYQILSFMFSGSEGFAVTDVLKMATPTLNPKSVDAPDVLEMKADYFKDVLAKSKRPVKEVLMDQKKMRGVGNSYADEILWHARVSPFSVASAIPDKIIDKLFLSLNSVLKKAIDEIAAENGDELKGELRDFMKIHGAGIKISPTGAEVKSEKIGGRTSYYTDEQKIYK